MPGIPAFTVLEDAFQFPQESMIEQRPPWQMMYESNILGESRNSSFSQYGISHTDSDYESLTQETHKPQLASNYEDSHINTSKVNMHNARYNLPTQAPVPLQKMITLPEMHPPYGTPYPTGGYSAQDGIDAINTGIPQAYSIPGVPVGSWPALIDARDSPDVHMEQSVAAEHHFKEGFKQGMEHYSAPSCADSIAHIQSCRICSHFVSGDLRFYRIAIGFLIFLVLVLLYILFRKISKAG